MTPPEGVAGVVLAAGAATRMGGWNKLLLPLGPRPVVRHSVDTASAEGLSPLIVVAGHRADELRGALAGSAVELVVNADYRDGLSTSVSAGLRSVRGRARAAVILLADEPGVRAAAIRAVIEAWRATGAYLIRVHYRDRPGHPVLVDAAAFERVAGLSGDRGFRELFGGSSPDGVEVTVDADAPIDIDDEAAYHAAVARLRR